jgi:stage III sporulation protein AB
MMEVFSGTMGSLAVEKMAGGFLVMTAIVGGLYSWREKKRHGILQMREVVQFYIRAHYAMEIEKMSMPEFFEEYHTKEAILQQFLDALTKMLQNHQCPTGEEAWERACQETFAQWFMPEEIWEVFLHSGKAFFGSNLQENLLHMDAAKEQMQLEITQEKQQLTEKQKVFFPVGILGGVFVILVLI